MQQAQSAVQSVKAVAEPWEGQVASSHLACLGGHSYVPPSCPRQPPQTFPYPGEAARLICSRPFDPSPCSWHRLAALPVCGDVALP